MKYHSSSQRIRSPLREWWGWPHPEKRQTVATTRPENGGSEARKTGTEVAAGPHVIPATRERSSCEYPFPLLNKHPGDLVATT